MLLPNYRQILNLLIGVLVGAGSLLLLNKIEVFVSESNSWLTTFIEILFCALGGIIAVNCQDAWEIFSFPSGPKDANDPAVDYQAQHEYLKRFIRYKRMVVMPAVFAIFCTTAFVLIRFFAARNDDGLSQGPFIAGFIMAGICAGSYWMGTAIGLAIKGRYLTWSALREKQADKRN